MCHIAELPTSLNWLNIYKSSLVLIFLKSTGSYWPLIISVLFPSGVKYDFSFEYFTLISDIGLLVFKNQKRFFLHFVHSCITPWRSLIAPHHWRYGSLLPKALFVQSLAAIGHLVLKKKLSPFREKCEPIFLPI